MDLIERVEDTFDNAKKSIKKLDKKQVLLVLGALAAVLGLIVYMRNKDTESQQEYAGVIAGGGAGDIAYGGGGGANAVDTNQIIDEYNSILSELGEQYNTELTGIQSQYNQNISDMETKYTGIIAETEYYYQDKVNLLEDNLADTQADLATAKTNQVSYDKNLDYQAAINRLISGGTSGSDDTVSNLVIGRAAKIAATDSLSKYAVTYDKNVDYQAAINQAKESGAAQSVIDTLTSQRAAKIAGENLTATGAPKTATVAAKPATTTTTTTVKPATTSKPATTAAPKTDTNYSNMRTAAIKDRLNKIDIGKAKGGGGGGSW